MQKNPKITRIWTPEQFSDQRTRTSQIAKPKTNQRRKYHKHTKPKLNPTSQTNIESYQTKNRKKSPTPKPRTHTKTLRGRFELPRDFRLTGFPGPRPTARLPQQTSIIREFSAFINITCLHRKEKQKHGWILPQNRAPRRQTLPSHAEPPQAR